MYSKLLKENGLVNYISGSDFHMRTKLIGESVKEEVEEILKIMGEKPKEIYSGGQVHGDTIKYCSGFTGKEFIYGRFFPDTDGLITDQVETALVIKFADCTPVILFDPINKVQAAVHSGWRGTLKQISKKAINMMVSEFSCNLDNIVAYLGPSIDMENYEVGPEVYNAFKDFKNRDDFFKKSGEKYKMSMIDANLEILLEAGIKRENIDICRESTYTNKDLNSARRDGEGYKLNSIFTIMK